jgi:hypothetical protein
MMSNISSASANGLESGRYAFGSVPEVNSQTSIEIIASDARATVVNDFFRRYKSPMLGLGNVIVETADTYALPFGLLPAIAQCEGNLGKVMPENSFNTWGWAIYGDKVTRFTSWKDGIEKVSRGLRNNYFNKGLDTPEKIMRKYTPSSNGSWAFCVSQFLAELK